MKYVIVMLVLALGVFCVVDGFQRSAGTRQQRELNPLELKASPYGEIVGAALQEPVSIISHGGIGHQHVGEAEECETCGVSHGGGIGHQHVGEGEECEACVVSHGGGHTEGRPQMTQWKLDLRKLGSEVRQNNLPGSRSAGVLAYENNKVEELMTLAYEMDPTNHGNFSVYSGFSAGKGGFEVRYAIAQKTLLACEGKVNDPGDALTAAAAAETILVYRAIEMDKNGLENPYLASDLQLLEQNVLRFRSSFERALDEGRLAHFSQKKADDMLEILSRLSWTVRSYKEKLDAAVPK